MVHSIAASQQLQAYLCLAESCASELVCLAGNALLPGVSEGSAQQAAGKNSC